MGRVGLVLGAGGAVGHAFHAGVLAALEHEMTWKPDSAEVIVGTSAGSVVAALIRAGCTASDLANASLGEPLSPAGRALLEKIGPPTEMPFPGVRQVDVWRGPAAAHLLRRPWRIRPGTLGAALLPPGNVPSDAVAAGVRNLYGNAWPVKPTWICAVRLDDGRLVVFGRAGSPPASIGDAVAASCAIPAYFTPVVIGGQRHVDGGVHSVTNADQLADVNLDLVVVSCPMGSTPGTATLSADLPLRAAVQMRLAREAATVRRAGIELVSFLPTAADRTAMGANPMDIRRSKAVTKQAFESTVGRLKDAGFRGRLAALG
ncbi:MAG TPA: patatin-like phospholipase family protein [Candidatus Dormibacteraeota bacterium]|nr:patatin-like phospholipase family protein [Candidatus Dormibacteraeota bacterium]